MFLIHFKRVKSSKQPLIHESVFCLEENTVSLKRTGARRSAPVSAFGGKETRTEAWTNE
jgi:hypothetical protein